MNCTNLKETLEFCLSAPATSLNDMAQAYAFLFENQSHSDDEISDEENGDESSQESDDDSEIDEDDELEDLVCKEFMELAESYTDEDFKINMRVNRTTAEFLTVQLKQYMLTPEVQTPGKSKISCRESVYMYLWYVGNTINYAQLAELFQVAKSTAWKIVRTVSDCLLSLKYKLVKWPLGANAKQMQQLFEAKTGIPGVMGSIDCVRIPMRTPKSNKEIYYDHNKEFSFVLQTVVDANNLFVDIYCGEPGSMRKDAVLCRSQIYKEAIKDTERLFPNDGFLVGDTAYPLFNWLIPPYQETEELSEEQLKFNCLHKSTRKVAANALGLLKGRFRRLFHATEHITLQRLFNLVCSVCILHNICVKLQDLPDETWKIVDDYPTKFYDMKSVPEHLKIRRDSILDALNIKNLLI